jgi:predicted cupin superfamily sugar epimerase
LSKITADQVISLLNLRPLEMEGGYYLETYRSGLVMPEGIAIRGARGPRPLGTAIYYLLTPGTFSELHRLSGDEIYHFYLGDVVEMLQLWPGGKTQVVRLGSDLLEGLRPQVVVPGGVWQGSRLSPGGRFALLGTTMSPGYCTEDYQTGQRQALEAEYPEARELIRALTRTS